MGYGTRNAIRDMRYYETCKTCETCETRDDDMNMGRKRNSGIWDTTITTEKGSHTATQLLISGFGLGLGLFGFEFDLP